MCTPQLAVSTVVGNTATKTVSTETTVGEGTSHKNQPGLETLLPKGPAVMNETYSACTRPGHRGGPR